MHRNDFSDGTCSITQRVVSFGKSFDDCEVLVNLTQTFVVDDQQCVNILAHLLHTIQGLVNLLVTFPTERNGHNTNCKDTHVLGSLGNERSSTSTCTTSHTSRDEGHLRTIREHALNGLYGLLCGFSGLIRTVTSTKTFATQLNLFRHR